MIRFDGRAILLDVEGTTSSVRYVADTLIPFARLGLTEYLETEWNSPEFAEAREWVARDLGAETYADWRMARADEEDALDAMESGLIRLMDRDPKAVGLKIVQGLIWKRGFASGELRSHVYPDVRPALEAWNRAGIDVRVFSSGSVSAQRRFFAHTEAGDLSHHFRGHYDSRIGSKREAQSYRLVAKEFNKPPETILYVGDIVEELDAARDAGMPTALALRPGNAPVPDDHGHPAIATFEEIEIAR